MQGVEAMESSAEHQEANIKKMREIQAELGEPLAEDPPFVGTVLAPPIAYFHQKPVNDDDTITEGDWGYLDQPPRPSPGKQPQPGLADWWHKTMNESLGAKLVGQTIKLSSPHVFVQKCSVGPGILCELRFIPGRTCCDSSEHSHEPVPSGIAAFFKWGDVEFKT